MKTKFSRKVLALVLAFALVVPMFVLTTNAAEYTETTSFGEGKFLITTTFDGSTYYLPATTTSSGPLAASFTNVSDISEDHLWTVTATGSNWYIQNSAGKYLYTTNTNNGVRVGDTARAWAYDSSANSFKDTVTNRYLGIYNATNWRCYTTVNQSNYKESSTSFKFYKVNESAASVNISSAYDYVEVGNTLTLSATLANLTGEVTWSSSNENVATVDSNGKVTAKAMGTTTITASVGETKGVKVISVYPIDESALTVEQALLVCQMTGADNCPFTYSVVGVIESIDTEYSTDFDNITVTINDGTGSIKAFRMAGGSDLYVGDTITVTGTLVNYSGNTPEFIQGCTYVKDVNESVEAIRAAINAIAAQMSLAYQYNVSVSKDYSVTDTLDNALTGISGTTYSEWSGKTSNSSAVYAGQSAGGNSAIQLRSNNSNSGIVTTVSGGKVTKITVVWNSNTAADRTINIYGSNTAYTSPTELYGDSLKGELIGTIVCGTSTELVIEGDYEYIGIRSKSGALYLDSVSISLESDVAQEVTTYSDSEFVIRCGVDAGLVDIENVDSYGIKVTAGGNEVLYTPDTVKVWGNDGDFCYVTISLGGIINDVAKLGTEFTVAAVVTVDGVDYVSETVATYSVATMINEYNGMDGVDVSDLYNYLVSKGLI